MKNDSKNIDCGYIEKIIFEDSIEDISEIEKTKILDHISECMICKRSEKLMEILSDSLLTEFENSRLVAKPETIKSLRNVINPASRDKRSLFGFIEGFLEFRVPVYQVIIALLVIVLIIIFVNNPRQEFDSLNNNISFIAEIDSNKILMNFQNSPDMIKNSSKGKSFVEDSVLSSFIQSAM